MSARPSCQPLLGIHIEAAREPLPESAYFTDRLKYHLEELDSIARDISHLNQRSLRNLQLIHELLHDHGDKIDFAAMAAWR